MTINKLKKELQKIRDPRRERGNLRHKLEDILIIGLCSVICCGEDFVDMEEFGKDREEWLREFLELPNGIPDSDTFRRVYERVEPNALAKSLNAWLDSAGSSGGRGVNIDGKTICGSKSSKHPAYHVVSAWVAENHITLGELAVDEKSNEITAIPELLDLIDVEGDIVTIDAMGCQTYIAAKIREKGADYKRNIHKTRQQIIGKASRRNATDELKHVKSSRLQRIGWRAKRTGWIFKPLFDTVAHGKLMGLNRCPSVITSAASILMRRVSVKLFVGIGRLKTNCTGCLMWYFTKTIPELKRIIHRSISMSSVKLPLLP